MTDSRTDARRLFTLRLAIGSAILFPLLGWGILYIAGFNFLELLNADLQAIPLQLGVGLLAGLIAGGGAALLITRPFQKPIYDKYAGFIQSLRLSWVDILLISLCAGVGEELLFRLSIQPLLGIWLTAVVFVLLHGYLSPKNWRLSIYGLYLTAAIAGFGYLCDGLGVIAAIVGHAVIDVILLALLAYTNKQPLFLR